MQDTWAKISKEHNLVQSPFTNDQVIERVFAFADTFVLASWPGVPRYGCFSHYLLKFLGEMKGGKHHIKGGTKLLIQQLYVVEVIINSLLEQFC